MVKKHPVTGQACPLPPKNIVIEGAEFIYEPNFEGREGRFNDEGERFFNVRIPANIIDDVVKDGWNVKWTKPKSDEYEPEPYLVVHVGFKYRPPHIVLVQDGQETLLSEQTAGIIDKLEFDTMDLVIRGRDWNNDMGCGIKAWLQTFYGVVQMDDIQRKYARMRHED